MFDLSASAMKGTLSMLAESSDLVKEVDIHGTSINRVLDDHGHTVRISRGQGVAHSTKSLILLELASVHARFYTQVEPTFLLIDGLLGEYHRSRQGAIIERLQVAAELAQVAVISASSRLPSEVSREWRITELEFPRLGDAHIPDCPIDFRVETTTAPPPASDPQ
jgi:hypothetical protein